MDRNCAGIESSLGPAASHLGRYTVLWDDMSWCVENLTRNCSKLSPPERRRTASRPRIGARAVTAARRQNEQSAVCHAAKSRARVPHNEIIPSQVRDIISAMVHSAPRHRLNRRFGRPVPARSARGCRVRAHAACGWKSTPEMPASRSDPRRRVGGALTTCTHDARKKCAKKRSSAPATSSTSATPQHRRAAVLNVA